MNVNKWVSGSKKKGYQNKSTQLKAQQTNTFCILCKRAFKENLYGSVAVCRLILTKTGYFFITCGDRCVHFSDFGYSFGSFGSFGMLLFCVVRLFLSDA